MKAWIPASVLLAAVVAGQSTKPWTLPHTADGQPDIQGVWSTATTTPLERPAEFAGNSTLTAAEAAEFQKKAIYDVNGDRRDGGGAADVGVVGHAGAPDRRDARLERAPERGEVGGVRVRVDETGQHVLAFEIDDRDAGRRRRGACRD